MESKIQMSLILTNIKNMMLVVMVINCCVDDKFSKPYLSYPGKDAGYNFTSSIIEESKYCSDVMKKHFNKELLLTKKR